ncbi:hypothetical protein CO046_04215 [Candidatus Peregrinibacteria bacterium CG_4_9_14_0_2_um_filter_53_11]|nr:MAG: hypothetical protein CO046_04215 [Candidatus Peregrinibacteria bacterium CG_4_9_14_0_2_um_filter_53_11]
MDRKGVYNKGRAGHARQVGNYRLIQQKYKKWRVGVAGLIGAFLVFAAVPEVGNLTQTSLLTSDTTVQLVQENPEEARKLIMDYTHGVVSSCTRYNLDECAAEGKELLSKLAESNSDVPALLSLAEAFEQAHTADLGLEACRYELAKKTLELKTFGEELATFVSAHEGLPNSELVADGLDSLAAAHDTLQEAVDSCYAAK